MTSSPPSVDLDYASNFRKTQQAKNLPYFINPKGDN